MRALYLNPFSQEVSGPDESLLTLLSRLIPKGVEAHVVLPATGPQRARYDALGARTHLAPMTVLRREPSLQEVIRLFKSGIESVPRMVQLCREVRPNIIHTNMEVVVDGLIAAKYLGIPHVLHYRGNTFDQPKVVFDALTLLWSGLSAQVFCISRATARLFESRGRAANVEVMYNPVDIQLFRTAHRQSEIRAQLGAGDEAWLVGTVARLHPRKDLETFLRAASLFAGRVESSRFVIVGAAAGPDEEAYAQGLRRLAAQLGLEERVTWAGARRDIPAVMKSLDAFVLTSRHEGFGRVVAESMAAGCPVIVTDEGAPPELTDGDRYGLRGRPGDPASFAERLLELWLDPDLRSRLARGGRDRSQAFDADTVAARVLQTYERINAT